MLDALLVKLDISYCFEKITSNVTVQDRQTGALLLLLEIEPFEECTVSYDYSTRWPKWTEYPADANYGRFLPGLMLTYR